VIALRWHARRQTVRERTVSTEEMAPTEFTTRFLSPDAAAGPATGADDERREDPAHAVPELDDDRRPTTR